MLFLPVRCSKTSADYNFLHEKGTKEQIANMPVPGSRSQSPGKRGGGGTGSDPKKQGQDNSAGTQQVANRLKKLYCAEHLKSGKCKHGDSCPFPHHDQSGVDALQKALKNNKAQGAAKAEAEPKAKAKGKAKGKAKAKANPAVAVATADADS